MVQAHANLKVSTLSSFYIKIITLPISMLGMVRLIQFLFLGLMNFSLLTIVTLKYLFSELLIILGTSR